jgi:hypothetical protein
MARRSPLSARALDHHLRPSKPAQRPLSKETQAALARSRQKLERNLAATTREIDARLVRRK